MRAEEFVTAHQDYVARSAIPSESGSSSALVVNSHNEWDPLEEVIVGRIERSIFPPQHRYILGGAPQDFYDFLGIVGGMRMRPQRWFMNSAQRELDQFVHLLEAEGVTVRRPDVVNHHAKYGTPQWSSRGQTSACPRDCFLVIGDNIIESPMSWRCRYFEVHAYYSLLKEYFDNGARWTSAPKPPLRDSLYDKYYNVPNVGEPMRYVINETEIVFDAADFTRCGRDLFVTRSNVTNEAGIAWLQRQLGDQYRIHVIETLSRQPMHIDTTFVPLGPGKAMINPRYVRREKLPPVLKTWDIFDAPAPVIVKGGFLNEHASMCSMWLNMNVLLLDEQRVVVERAQESMIKALRKWGLKPIPCDFLHFNPFGGAFHCATLDVRRRGSLQSYF